MASKAAIVATSVVVTIGTVIVLKKFLPSIAATLSL